MPGPRPQQFGGTNTAIPGNSSALDEVDGRPAGGVFFEGEAGAGGEGLQAEFAVEDGVGEAELAVLVRVVAAEGDGGHEGGERVAGLGDLADDLQFARADRGGRFRGRG